MTDGLFSVNTYKLPNLEEEEALWHLAGLLSLCDEELYLLSYSFLPPAFHHLLINVHSLRLICPPLFPSASYSLFSLVSPESDTDRWWSQSPPRQRGSP